MNGAEACGSRAAAASGSAAACGMTWGLWALWGSRGVVRELLVAVGSSAFMGMVRKLANPARWHSLRLGHYLSYGTDVMAKVTLGSCLCAIRGRRCGGLMGRHGEVRELPAAAAGGLGFADVMGAAGPEGAYVAFSGVCAVIFPIGYSERHE